MSLRKWYFAAKGSPNAHPTLYNMLFDVRHKRIDKALFKEFHAKLSARWEELETTQLTQYPENVVAEIADSMRDKIFGKGPSIKSSYRLNAGLSRVMDADTLFERHVYKSGIGHETTSATPSPRAIARVEKYGLSATSIRKEKKGAKLLPTQMRGKRAFAWVTATFNLDALRRKHTRSQALAHEVRNQLGLINYEKKEYLIEIRYPQSIVKRLLTDEKLHAPTFVEGCPNMIYRSSNSDADGWGHTVNMGSKDFGNGLPEGICPATDFSEKFCVVGIGQLDRKCTLSWNHYLKTYNPGDYDYKDLDDYAK